MSYPKFFDEIEHIVLQDELSDFLGSTEDGIIDISYPEIVKMSGHSCGVVSGSYLMTLKGLKKLFGTETLKRGEIKVELRGTLADNIGVMTLVTMNITGATTDSGFMGIQGKYNRRGLLFYGANIQSDVRFTRLDTNESVEVSYTPGKVVTPGNILMSAIGPDATEESRRTFPVRWQEMVKTIFDNAHKVIEVI